MRTVQILEWAWKTFSPDIAALSSFQTLPLLHIISQTCPDMRIIFVDTGFHFQETLTFRDRIVDRLNLNLVVAKTNICRCTIVENQLFFENPDLCCMLNKVEPMYRIIESLGLSALVSGIRRDQTETRCNRGALELLESGLVRVHPMIDWTSDDIGTYIREHGLPVHPLTECGYSSIGCAPCTCPVVTSEGNERAGRWVDRNKIECEMHDNYADFISDTSRPE